MGRQRIERLAPAALVNRIVHFGQDVVCSYVHFVPVWTDKGNAIIMRRTASGFKASMANTPQNTTIIPMIGQAWATILEHMAASSLKHTNILRRMHCVGLFAMLKNRT